MRTEIVSESVMSPETPETWLDKKAVSSMESFLDGEVEYFVSVPTFWDNTSKGFVPRPLIFRTFSKSDRPRAWKGCDLRIQSTLPVVGVDDSNGRGSADAAERLIRVLITLTNPKDEE